SASASSSVQLRASSALAAHALPLPRVSSSEAKQLDGSHLELIDTLSVCTQSLLHIANDVLDIAKLESSNRIALVLIACPCLPSPRPLALSRADRYSLPIAAFRADEYQRPFGGCGFANRTLSAHTATAAYGGDRIVFPDIRATTGLCRCTTPAAN